MKALATLLLVPSLLAVPASFASTATPAVAAPAAGDSAGTRSGGLATIRALFTRTGSFDAYVAASPSIWFRDRAALADETRFAAAVRDGCFAPRVLLTVGGGEDRGVRVRPGGPISQEAVDAHVRYTRMIAEARELATRLGSVPGAPGYRVEFVSFSDENHVTVVPALIARGLTFALAR